MIKIFSIWGRLMQTKSKSPFGIPYRKAVKILARARGAKGSKLTVLDAILDCCNATTGQAFPGNTKIMNDANVKSKETLNNALQWLQANGILKSIAYEAGGHGRARVWGFCLPGWTTPENVESSLKTGEVDNANNLPSFQEIPPQFSGDTSPVSREPTERTERKGKEDEDTPSRRDVNKAHSGEVTEEQRIFSTLLKENTYGEARRKLDEWKRAQDLAAE